MPTYLSVSFEYRKKQLSGQTVRLFCDELLDCGMTFAGGYWGSERDSYEDIIRWNQEKLAENYELADTEHYAKGYKQMLFHFGGFSEVRLFVMNEKSQPYFTFELIVPEEDFFGGQDAADGGDLDLSRLEQVEALAVRMWERGVMSCIQACWESWDEPRMLSEIEAGVRPCCTPFCIVPLETVKGRWQLPFRQIDRNGAWARDISMFRIK